MVEAIDDERLVQFCELVEEKTGQEPLLDIELGNELGWFMIETSLELKGETFNAEVDFNLSESSIEPLYAEIYTEDNDERTAVLDEVAARLDADLYEYYVNEDEIADLLADLREAHTEAFE